MIRWCISKPDISQISFFIISAWLYRLLRFRWILIWFLDCKISLPPIKSLRLVFLQDIVKNLFVNFTQNIFYNCIWIRRFLYFVKVDFSKNVCIDSDEDEACATIKLLYNLNTIWQGKNIFWINRIWNWYFWISIHYNTSQPLISWSEMFLQQNSIICIIYPEIFSWRRHDTFSLFRVLLVH